MGARRSTFNSAFKGDTFTFTYDTLNGLSTKAAPSEATVTYGYDLAGRATSATDTGAAITSPAASASYSVSYSYDAIDRPLGIVWSPAPAQAAPSATSVGFTHVYDATNRRIGQTASDNSWWQYPAATASSVTYVPNALNQYTAVGSAAPTYDGDGNLAVDGTLTYGYDAESRLTSVKQGSTTAGSYVFDAQGRRKSKTAGSATTIYVTDADNREVLEYDGTSGALQAWYAFALGPDAVLNRMNVAAASRQTMIPDIQGSIIATLDSGTGALIKAGYQPYGENPAATTGSYRYTGRRIDPETAAASQPSALYHYRAREYSPTWGRFLQPDPIGYAGGGNLYAYVANDPLNLIDPSGLRPGDSYPSGISAAKAAINDINPTSIDQDLEYAGRIYFSPLTLSYSYTSPTSGTTTRSMPGGVPFLTFGVGTYHTHGSEWSPDSTMTKLGENFSQKDINLANSLGQPSYLGTPSGQIMEYDPNNGSSGAITVLGQGAVPADQYTRKFPSAPPPSYFEQYPASAQHSSTSYCIGCTDQPLAPVAGK